MEKDTGNKFEIRTMIEFNREDYNMIVDPHGYSTHDPRKGERDWDVLPDGRLMFWEKPNPTPNFLWPGIIVTDYQLSLLLIP